MAPLRIAFFGLPLAAILLTNDGHDIALACVCRDDALGLRRLRRQLGPERVIVKPRANDPALAERLRALAPDLLVSWFWTTRLPMPLVAAARLGGIGVHPSLLPRHRGPDPTYWAIASGDVETGVTAHRIEEDYDTGAILGRERLAIDPTWTAWNLARALDRPSLRLLRATVARFSRGEEVTEEPQDASLVTEAPAPTEEQCALRWSSPTAEILRHIRALSPAPGAWTEVDGRCVVVLTAEAAERYPSALLPGEGAALDGRAVIRTGDGAVALASAEIDGEPADSADLAALFDAHRASY